MADNYFKKILWITDCHFGRSGNSPLANQDNLDFIQWATDRARTWGADHCIFGGDYFDNRHTIGVLTMHYALQGLEILNNNFKKIDMLAGNHDLPYRDKRDAASIEIARNLSNINIIREPTTINDVTMLPWLIGDERKLIKTIKSRYVFGHLEMPGFMMNAKTVLPADNHMSQASEFNGPEYVWTGHFHARQSQKYNDTEIIYTGNCMPHNFADDWDEDRGIMLFEWGKQPVFEAWQDQPVYRSAKLSEILADPKKIMRAKATIRAIIDVPLHFDEVQEIRTALETEYGVRKLELIPMQHDDSDQEFKNENIVFKSVDQMVLDGIASIDSKNISTERLADIYRSLPQT